mgnify:CR=1 FL=1
MKARLRAFTAAILFLVAASGALRAHPIHTSVAEADYNAASGNLEVALRVAGIVGAPLLEGERGGVAGVADGDPTDGFRSGRTGFPHDEHRHVVIDRPAERRARGEHARHLRLGVVAAVDGEAACALMP